MRLAAQNYLPLRDDVVVSRGEGVHEHVSEFMDDELLRPLERWFFGHPAQGA